MTGLTQWPLHQTSEVCERRFTRQDCLAAYSNAAGKSDSEDFRSLKRVTPVNDSGQGQGLPPEGDRKGSPVTTQVPGTFGR